MIVEERIFTFHPGKVKQYMPIYEAEGLPLQQAHLGSLIGYFVVDVGPLNQIVHLWGYKDMAERETQRAQLSADPAWQAYLPKIHPMLLSMENKILIPTRFSPIR